MGNSVILWLHRALRILLSRCLGTPTRAATISGRVNAGDNVRHLGSCYASPSNTLVSLCSHVYQVLFLAGMRGSVCPWLLPGSFMPGLPATLGSAGPSPNPLQLPGPHGRDWLAHRQKASDMVGPVTAAWEAFWGQGSLRSAP